MGTAVAAEQEGVARRVVTCSVGILRYFHQSAIGVLRTSGADSLGYYGGFGVLTYVNHLGTRISFLMIVGDGNGVELSL